MTIGSIGLRPTVAIDSVSVRMGVACFGRFERALGAILRDIFSELRLYVVSLLDKLVLTAL